MDNETLLVRIVQKVSLSRTRQPHYPENGCASGPSTVRRSKRPPEVPQWEKNAVDSEEGQRSSPRVHVRDAGNATTVCPVDETFDSTSNRQPFVEDPSTEVLA